MAIFIPLFYAIGLILGFLMSMWGVNDDAHMWTTILTVGIVTGSLLSLRYLGTSGRSRANLTALSSIFLVIVVIMDAIFAAYDYEIGLFVAINALLLLIAAGIAMGIRKADV